METNQEARPKILYIDDTPYALELVSRVLSDQYDVLSATDALTGIEMAVELKPDLIMLDVNLPHLGGREVATRLRSLLPNTPLVAFTADASSKARARALAAGCVGYLTKPLDVDSFADEVGAFLRGKRESAPNVVEVGQAYHAELVEQLENKIRELTQATKHNAFLNKQNRQMVLMLQRRQQLLEAASRVAQNVTSILDLDELLHTTVDIICEEYDFYYAAIFLLDPTGEWAVLRAGRGEAGAAMLAEGHKLEVGGQSMIGSAMSTREAYIAWDVGEEQMHFKNPHLPHTRSEMALPLIVKNEVLGALSVQSDEVHAFADDDITALQALANQVAIAINTARLLQDLNGANRELVRNKTLEAIATATGEAIHWVGNKAAPIPDAARRVREDMTQLLAMMVRLLNEPLETRDQHPFWPVILKVQAEALEQGIDLEDLADELGSYLSWQLERLGGLESVLEDLMIVERSAKTILNIKEDLIGPARLRQIAPVWLPLLLHDTIMGMGLPAGIVQRDFMPDLPPVRGDERQLNQLFNNLIKNAWEALHNHPQPQINVRATRAPGDPNYVMVQVKDNGPGIAPDLLDKIWVSFFTTKGKRGGTGLGLSACMEIVNQSEGKISVESVVDYGTTFTILLPIATERSGTSPLLPP